MAAMAVMDADQQIDAETKPNNSTVCSGVSHRGRSMRQDKWPRKPRNWLNEWLHNSGAGSGMEDMAAAIAYQSEIW